MKAHEEKMLAFYRRMDEDDQRALLRYAEFLSQAKKGESDSPVLPDFIPPARDESVIGALKRLSASYPMLDKGNMLDQASLLVSEHLLQGRAKEEIIHEFDILFDQQYQEFIMRTKAND